MRVDGLVNSKGLSCVVQAEGRAWAKAQSNERVQHTQRTEIACSGNLGCVQESEGKLGRKRGETEW